MRKLSGDSDGVVCCRNLDGMTMTPILEFHWDFRKCHVTLQFCADLASRMKFFQTICTAGSACPGVKNVQKLSTLLMTIGRILSCLVGSKARFLPEKDHYSIGQYVRTPWRGPMLTRQWTWKLVWCGSGFEWRTFQKIQDVLCKLDKVSVLCLCHTGEDQEIAQVREELQNAQPGSLAIRT